MMLKSKLKLILTLTVPRFFLHWSFLGALTVWKRCAYSSKSSSTTAGTFNVSACTAKQHTIPFQTYPDPKGRLRKAYLKSMASKYPIHALKSRSNSRHNGTTWNGGQKREEMIVASRTSRGSFLSTPTLAFSLVWDPRLCVKVACEESVRPTVGGGVRYPASSASDTGSTPCWLCSAAAAALILVLIRFESARSFSMISHPCMLFSPNRSCIDETKIKHVTP